MGFIKRLSEKLNLRSEALPGNTIVELSGNDRVLVENFRNVVMFDTDSINLEVSFGLLTVLGKELVLDYLEKDRILISGSIKNIQIGGEC